MAVDCMISFTRAGSSTPGNCTRIWYCPSPCSWITGSVTPNWSIRLRIVSIACVTARFFNSASACGFMLIVQEFSAPEARLYSGSRSLTIDRRSELDSGGTPLSTILSGLLAGSGWVISV